MRKWEWRFRAMCGETREGERLAAGVNTGLPPASTVVASPSFPRLAASRLQQRPQLVRLEEA